MVKKEKEYMERNSWYYPRLKNKIKYGLYINDELVFNKTILKDLLSFNYDDYDEGDCFEFKTPTNNSINKCCKKEFLLKLQEHYDKLLNYRNKKTVKHNHKTKYVTCKNCGKRFRVPIKSRKKFCSKKCKKEYNNYVWCMHNTNYMKKLRDKINYNPKDIYCEWMDDLSCTKTVEDGVTRYHNKKIGNYYNTYYKTKKRKNESWESYHERLQRIKKK